MKKINYLIFLFGLISFPVSVNAMSPKELLNRNFCNTKPFELAYANSDGSVSNKACYDTYDEALNNMNQSVEDGSDNLIIIEGGVIVNAKYALIDYEQKTTTTYLYKNKNDTSSYTYIAGGGSDDAALLEVDYHAKKAKIKLAGFTGWIHRFEDDKQNSTTYGYKQYEIVPISWVKSPSYYEVGLVSNTKEDYISHNLPGNVYGDKSTLTNKYGKKPSMLNYGRYYSYDGIYFYNDLKTMLNDYKLNTYEHAVNSKDAYYNFYLYLNYRTKSNYTADDIDKYIKDVKRLTASNSKFYDSGKYFENAQNNYGINLALMFSVGANESAYGTSNIAMNKNNLFGLNAVDSSPGLSADMYKSVEDCIDTYAYSWLSYGYIQPGDWRWFGSNLGSKDQGLNVKYASDPYWSEKAAGRYYELDKYYGFQDYNSYQEAVLNNDYPDGVKAYKGVSKNDLPVSSKYYKFTRKNQAVVILKEVEGPNVGGSTIWYQITSDPTLDPTNLEYIGDSKSNPRHTYDWSKMLVYVPSIYFSKVNVKETDNILENPVNQGEEGNKPTPSPSPTPSPTPTPSPSPTPSPTPTPSPSPTPTSPILPSNPNVNLTEKTANNYYFNELTMSGNDVTVSGHLSIQGMDNKKSSTKNYMIFKNMLTNKEYYYKLDEWTGSFTMTNQDEAVKYDYSGGWFKSKLDLSFLEQGDYQIYVEVATNNFKVRRNFNNLFYKTITRKNTAQTRGYQFLMNYLDRSMPMELTIRDEGLISKVNPPTIDTMYNSFTHLSFDKSKLRIRGVSHNVGVNYSTNSNVERTLVLENIENFQRKTYNVGSITNGDYQVTLKVSDGFDKTRVWFDTTIDIKDLSSGVYAIYLKTKVQNNEDYGELNDIMFKTINVKTTINGKNVYIRRVDNKRYRIELVIE